MDELLVAIQNAANTIAAPNWADIMSVCLSLLAVVVASFVAWRQNEISRKQTDIADKQNKIALFEKRLEIYEILMFCNSSVEILKLFDEDEDILKCLFTVFSETPKEQREYNRIDAKIYLTNCSLKLQQAAFFFPEKIVSYIIRVAISLLILIDADVGADGNKKFSKRKQDYFEAVKALEENEVFESMIEEMAMI